MRFSLQFSVFFMTVAASQALEIRTYSSARHDRFITGGISGTTLNPDAYYDSSLYTGVGFATQGADGRLPPRPAELRRERHPNLHLRSPHRCRRPRPHLRGRIFRNPRSPIMEHHPPRRSQQLRRALRSRGPRLRAGQRLHSHRLAGQKLRPGKRHAERVAPLNTRNAPASSGTGSHRGC